ncbi:ABC transporter ATP-binding protein [Microbacterium sp. GXS0129]|uniref:ABC transporter ATP-binding protein n=1 Tax=Microbacterium sp. GXS0129 TaxID=3377836 RepID=UPI00383A67DA
MRVDIDAVAVRLGGRDVVRDVSASIPSGHVVGVVGANGSGKSTLLRTIYRAITPAAGRVLVDGTDVRSLSSRRAACTVSVMLQDAPTDFDLSVEETVMLGRGPHHASFGRDSPEDLRIVAEAMIRTDVAGLADRMVATLSGGQRQRVMLARALAQQTPVMVLDEPSNHLDISHQHELMSTVRNLGCTVIAALHDLNLAAQYCDAVLVLSGGELIVSGPPAEVLTPALIRRVFGVDARLLGDDAGPVFAFRRLTPDATRPDAPKES